jgi:hypothetical protein
VKPAKHLKTFTYISKDKFYKKITFISGSIINGHCRIGVGKSEQSIIHIKINL